MLDTIKGYLVEEEVGSGGFGVVYRARQSSTFDREVAIKVIQPRYANQPDFIRRFESEAQLVARLEHPFIVPLYDFWREPDSAYLVMRWLSGGNIHDALKQGPLDVQFSMNVLQQVALALTTAHQQGVIHRDVKPSNILLDEHGNAYLADFGIAKDLIYRDTNATHPDAVIGSPGYLAPEQARREDLSPRTDVYSLGVTLYEMLAGEHPFKDANTVEKLYKHLNEALPLLDNIDPSIADAVNDVIQKATSKNPIERFADPLEMVAAFRDAIQYIEDEPENIVATLTRREQEILQMVVEGKSNKEIAAALFVTVSTVRTHLRQAYKKLNVRTRMQAIVRVRELNLVVNGDETVVGEYGSSAYIMLPEAHNPYKGLNAFTAADSKDFFGREALIKRLLHRMGDDVENRRFLAIVGPSGSGKSSLVKAGVVPAIWRGKVKGSDDWYTIDLIPGAHPLDELEVALQRVINVPNDNIHDHLMRDERGLVRVGQLILPEDQSELLIVVDQFEEVFTLVEDEEQRAHFLNLIQAAVTDPRSRVRIVITLRADFYDRPLQYPQFGELLRNRMETILPLSAEELEASIVQPAKAVGVKYADGVVASIIADVNYQPGALPLLQYALTELFDRHEKRLISRQHYQDIGGTVGAIAQRADILFEEFDEAGQQLARQLFLRLVTLGEGTEDTRRRVELRELLALSEQSDLAYEIIDAYAAYRLLSLDHDPATRQPTVEVAHEAILREWERLRKWLNDSRDDIKTQRQIATLATAWTEHKHDEAFLVRGSRLEGFQLWSLSTGLSLTPTEMDYLSASIDAHERREAEQQAQIEREKSLELRARKISQGLVAVFLVAAVVAIGLAAFAFSERSTAQEERNRAQVERDRAETAQQDALEQAAIGLAAQAELQFIAGNQDLAVLLALEALEEYPHTWQAESRLANLVSQYIPTRVIDVEVSTGMTTSVNWYDSQNKFIVVNNEGVLVVVDGQSGEQITSIRVKELLGTVINVAADLHPDDPIVVSSSVNEDLNTLSNVTIWNFESGATTILSDILDGEITDVAWSNDGDNIGIATDSYEILLLDSSAYEEAVRFSGHTNSINAIVWSPIANRFASVSDDGTVRIWDIESAQTVLIYDGHSGNVYDADWSPDGSLLATVSEDLGIHIWNSENGELVTRLTGNAAPLGSIQWSPDGSRVASMLNEPVESGCELFVWNMADTRQLEYKINTRIPSCGAIEWISDTEISVGLIVHLNIYDLETELPTLPAHSQWDAVWSPNGRYILSSSQERTDHDGFEPPGQARIWDAKSSDLVLSIDHPAIMTGVDWSPDGNFIATTALHGSTTIFDASTGDQISRFDHLLDWPFMVAWSPDGSKVVDSGSQSAYIWDPLTGAMQHELPTGCWGISPTWSPDGSKVILGCLITWPDRQQANGATVWDTETGELLYRVAVGVAPGGVDWSPDGEQFATAFNDPNTELGRIVIWDADSGEQLHVIGGHGTDRVWEVAWSPSGDLIATGDNAGLVIIWDADTYEPIMTVDTPDVAFKLDWHPDGTLLMVTGQFDRHTTFYRVWHSTDELIEYAYECCVNRYLTNEERARYGLPPVE